VIVAPFTQTALGEGATVLAHPNQVLFPNGTLTCLDAMSSYISAHPAIIADFRAAMDESVAYTQTHQAVVKQTLVKGLTLTPAVAAKQVLATNFDTTFNTASIGQIENDMKEFGIISSEPPASSMLWNP
jgi:hypothetical protein